MTLIEKLLGYLNRVFDKDPDSVLALRLNYDGAMTWRVSSGVLTTSVTGGTGGPLTVSLSGFSILGLSAYMAAQPGYSVPFTATGDIAARSALALMETSGNPAQSNGDHLMAFQSVLWAYLNAQSAELSTAQVAISEALLQTAAITASDTWVDEHGSYYGVSRTSGEADASYVARIVSEITRARGNGVAIAEAVKLGATASYVTVSDYPTVTVSGGGVGSYGLFDVDVEVPLESVLTQPQIGTNTLAVIDAMRDAGTHLRKLRYIRTATMTLWAGAYSTAGHYLTLGFDRYPFLFDGTYSYDGSHVFDGFIEHPTPPSSPSFTLLYHFDNPSADLTQPSSGDLTQPIIRNSAELSPGVAKFGSGAASRWSQSVVDTTTPLPIIGTGDFNLDFWAFTPSGGNYSWVQLHNNLEVAIFTNAGDDNGDYAPTLSITSSGILVDDFGGATPVAKIGPTGSPTLNAYNHIEVSRTAGILYLFLNGVLLNSVAYTTNLGVPSISPTVTVRSSNWAIDELRIVYGAGGHTSNFTPPTAQY